MGGGHCRKKRERSELELWDKKDRKWERGRNNE